MTNIDARSPIAAGVKRFLWLWLPGLIVFLAGLNRAFVTGQADPWDWAMPGAVVLIMIGFVTGARARLFMFWAGMGWAGSILIFCTMAAGRAPLLWAMGGVMLLAFLAGGGSILLRASLRYRVAGVASLVLAACLLWRGPPQPIQPMAHRPKLAVVTGLPLFWTEEGEGQRLDAPIIALLRTRFTVVPLDTVDRLAGSGAKLLILAQPRALRSEHLVEIDRWVRGGGRALVLADPLLRWPSSLPIGDRRRATTSAYTLEPLMNRWKILPHGMEPGESRQFLADGSLLTRSGAMDFGDGAVAYRNIGKGAVIWVGDADMLDDRLWLADPARPFDPRLWSADTPALITKWLGLPAPGQRRWMRNEDDVTLAVRWALLLGTGWAILGTALFRRIFGLSRRL